MDSVVRNFTVALVGMTDIVSFFDLSQDLGIRMVF